MRFLRCFLLVSILESQRIDGPTYTGVSFKDHGYYETVIETQVQADAFRGIAQNIQCDFFYPHNGAQFVVGETVKFLVQPEDKSTMDFFCDTMGFVIKSENHLDELIANEFDGKKGRSVGFDFNVYHTLQGKKEQFAYLDGLADVPGVTVSSIGNSVELRKLYKISIGNENLPKIVVDCGIHAREWAAHAWCYKLIDDLINGGSTDMKRNSVNWIIYPNLNPDGYLHTWTSYRYWRKNRATNAGSSCMGVDLNRNYDIEWMNAGTSNSPCSDIYGGPSAFSEPESRAHRDDMLAMDDKLAYLTYHAYSQFIIYPYSSSYAAEAWNKAELDSVAKAMVEKISDTTGAYYEYGEGAPSFYPASGGSDDWSHNDSGAGVRISLTIELRDRGQYGFALPESQLEDMYVENLAAIRTAYDHVAPGGSCNSPDLHSIGCPTDATCTYRFSIFAFVLVVLFNLV